MFWSRVESIFAILVCSLFDLGITNDTDSIVTALKLGTPDASLYLIQLIVQNL